MEKHGAIKCSNGSDYQSRCELACNRGYYLRNGINSTVCERNGRWTSELDACESKNNAERELKCMNLYFTKKSNLEPQEPFATVIVID